MIDCLSPEMGARVGIDELCVDPDPATGRLHRALEPRRSVGLGLACPSRYQVVLGWVSISPRPQHRASHRQIFAFQTAGRPWRAVALARLTDKSAVGCDPVVSNGVLRLANADLTGADEIAKPKLQPILALGIPIRLEGPAWLGPEIVVGVGATNAKTDQVIDLEVRVRAWHKAIGTQDAVTAIPRPISELPRAVGADLFARPGSSATWCNGSGTIA